ncbi:hypothetical protein M3Y99_01184800 [Aphelenchoides fujianensis]|nr:hypothetical protein M3Y99_01184800 [Aphelenchoides fujianensis]
MSAANIGSTLTAPSENPETNQSTVFRLRNDRSILNSPLVVAPAENPPVPIASFARLFAPLAVVLLVIAAVGVTLLPIFGRHLADGEEIGRAAAGGIRTGGCFVDDPKWTKCENLCLNNDFPHRKVAILAGEANCAATHQHTACFGHLSIRNFTWSEWSPCVNNLKYRIRILPRDFAVLDFTVEESRKSLVSTATCTPSTP